MSENYASAAARHFEDAADLRGAGRTDNAGHLIGFAAECAIKHNISSLRLGKASPHGHFPEILIAARKHLGPRAGYTQMFNLLRADTFRGWDISSRYMSTGHTNIVDLETWFQTTKRLFAAAGLKVRK